MIPIKNTQQIAEMSDACRITAEAMAEAIEMIREGVSTWDIDRVIRQYIEKRGAKRIFASCSHAILSDPAVQRINDSPIEKLVITDTIPLPPEKHSDKIVVLSLAEPIADVIIRIQSHRSVSQLFR